METVAISKCSTYDIEQIRQALCRSLAMLGGLERFVQPGERILLKVNCLNDASPERGITTHPAFLQAVIQLVKTRTDQIVVADSPGFIPFLSACQKNGYAEIAQQEGVELFEFIADDTLPNPHGLVYKHFPVSSRLRHVDRVFNLARLKTHSLMYLTLAVKNMLGLIPGEIKLSYHSQAGTDRMLFAKILVDIFRARQPDLNFVDGIVAMEGNGPSAGTLRKLGLVVVGASGFAVDDTIARIVGVDPERIPTQAVYRRFVLNGRKLEVEVRGELLSSLQMKNFRFPSGFHKGIPDWAYRLGKRWLLPRPVFLREQCTGCQVCVRICPAHALHYDKQKKILFDEKCIRCFCCQEMCPARAIGVKKPSLSFFSKSD